MTPVDLGHGRGWLDQPAAASLLRVDRQIGHPLQITDAGRTYEEQAYLRWLYEIGQGSFAAKPGESPHEFGNAIDTNERLVDILHDHGWRRPLSDEPWHFVYWPNLDNHINEEAPLPIAKDAEMYVISSANRQAHLVGPGWARQLNDEESINIGAIASKATVVNDRQFDLCLSVATSGTFYGTGVSDSQVKAIADQIVKEIGTTSVELDYAKIAKAVNDDVSKRMSS